MATKTEWQTLTRVAQTDCLSDAPYYEATRLDNKPEGPFSFSLHEDTLKKAPTFQYTSRVDTTLTSHSPQRKSVTGRPPLLSSYQPETPITYTQSNAPQESKPAKFCKNLGKILSWSFWNMGWPFLRFSGGLLWKLGLLIKKQAWDRKPQPLTLPGRMDETHPGWDVQAQQLAYEMATLKPCFVAIQKQNPSYPIKFALQVTFQDGPKTQTVLSSLLIQNTKEWGNLAGFVDNLYPQIVHMIKELPVSNDYSMEVAFVALCEDISDEESTFSIYQRSNTYSNGIDASDLLSDVKSIQCTNNEVAETVSSVRGVQAAISWLLEEEWKVTGEILATYQKGESDPIPLLIEQR
ncbi:hypothetical protein [Simkania sp.]|uniref:hypothetical protein n=1 Tax=Simkania sp. TaxID=34094 RepID=UPI003B5172E7